MAGAVVYKCEVPSGGIRYTDKPCPTDEHEAAVIDSPDGESLLHPPVARCGDDTLPWFGADPKTGTFDKVDDLNRLTGKQERVLSEIGFSLSDPSRSGDRLALDHHHDLHYCPADGTTFPSGYEAYLIHPDGRAYRMRKGAFELVGPSP